MVLSDMAVRRAKATGKAYDVYDTLHTEFISGCHRQR
jgi:hypothetical protein